MINNWMYLPKDLLKKVILVDEIYSKISERILRCPHCRNGLGHFFLERDDREYSSDSWWLCSQCWEEHTPSEARLKMIEDIVKREDVYWDYEAYNEIEIFEGRYSNIEFKSTRKFSVDEYNKEHPERTWEQLTTKLAQEHIKYVLGLIKDGFKYNLLKPLYKKLGIVKLKNPTNIKFIVLDDEHSDIKIDKEQLDKIYEEYKETIKRRFSEEKEEIKNSLLNPQEL